MWRFLTHCAAFDWHPSPLSAAGWGCGEIFWHQFRFFTPGGAAVEYRVNRCYYVLFFWGANEMFFTWQVSSLSQETFCITFTHFTSFSRHAEPDRLFSGAEIDVHVIRHNLLPKVSHRTDDVNYFAILIFGLDSVGMDISVSGSVAVVWSRLKTHKRLNVLLWNLAPIFIFVRWLCRCHCLVTSVFLSIVQFSSCVSVLVVQSAFPPSPPSPPWLLRLSPSPELSLPFPPASSQ